MSAHRVIDDVGSFISMITFLFGTGFTAWTCHFAHSTRLKQAEKILDDVTTFVNTLTEEDKRMIDAYIAEASVRRPSETQCLLNTEQIFARLAEPASIHQRQLDRKIELPISLVRSRGKYLRPCSGMPRPEEQRGDFCQQCPCSVSRRCPVRIYQYDTSSC